MDDLVAWLTACLDEMMRIAEQADNAVRVDSRNGARQWNLHQPDEWPGAGYVNNDYLCVGPEIAPHIFRHDPRAVLARVAAERAVLAQCVEESERRDATYVDGPDYPQDEAWVATSHHIVEYATRATDRILRALAHGHRYDYPGYRDEWAPS